MGVDGGIGVCAGRGDGGNGDGMDVLVGIMLLFMRDGCMRYGDGVMGDNMAILVRCRVMMGSFFIGGMVI